ncbi:unnamed protein product [Trichobilharzia szidati]|nr:unnamed protein product [Trichobilharzia szidati]
MKIWASVLLVLMIASVMCYCLSTHEVFRTRSSIIQTNAELHPTGSLEPISHNGHLDHLLQSLPTKQLSHQSLSHKSTPSDVIRNKQFPHANKTVNAPISICYNSLWRPNPKIQKDCSTEPSEGLVFFDISLNCLFTLEFLLKVLLAPDKPKFLSSIVSIFDMVILVSYWVYMSLFYYYYYYPKKSVTDSEQMKTELSGYLWLLNILSMTQALRILRVFKISKISRGLRVLILTVKKSIPELVLLGFLMMNGMFLFSSMMYIAEYRVNDTFPDIPQSFWWSIITLTAVGYGDMHPKGGAGYFVGSLTAISGCIVTGLAIPIVGNNFNTYYKYMKNQLMEDKYLKTLRKDMEATGGGSGTKSGLGVASEKSGLPLPGRKPRNINRKTIRGDKITKTDNMKNSLFTMMEVCARSVKRLLPTRLTSRKSCKPICVPKTNTTDSMQLLTENQKFPNSFTSKTTISEVAERKSSYKHQINPSNNLIPCNIKLNGEKTDIEHRPSLIYPLATDQLLNSLLPSQLPVNSTPQIWVDGEELDDAISSANQACDNSMYNGTSHLQPLCTPSAIDMSEFVNNGTGNHQLYSRMSIVSDEIIPNSIYISSNTNCFTAPNVPDGIQNDSDILSSGEDGDDEHEDSNCEFKGTKVKIKSQNKYETIVVRRKSNSPKSLPSRTTQPPISNSNINNNIHTSSNTMVCNNKPITKRMNYV